MQPWRVSVGLTAAIAGAAVLLLGPRLDCLAPYWREILAADGIRIGLNVVLALATLAAAIYAIACAAGLADLGKRVDLVEQSARRGEGDPGRGDALKKDAEGKWE